MPNFDAGTYFLTTLAPIKNSTVADAQGKEVSNKQNLRSLLNVLPTAMQSPATISIGLNSPFARNKRTHLCRYMVLDDVVYNGRLPQDAIVTSIKGLIGQKDGDPINPQPVDRLNAAYLMFTADFDAVLEDGDPLPAELTESQQNAVRDAYARKLWDTMEPELREIYSNCLGFDQVNDADGFADYIRRIQVETTMPFHDYWISPPDLKPLPIKPIAFGVGIPAVLTVLGLILWLFGAHTFGMFLFFAILTAFAAWAAYRFALANGQKPMPAAKYGDLPSVLKSLYVQQTFSDFVVEAQGLDDEALHKAFGDYLGTHRPGDKFAPSQKPGVISIKQDDAVVE